MAEFQQYYTSGGLRLAATCDMKKGEEVYLQHAPDAMQWSCFHPEKCTLGMYLVLLPWHSVAFLSKFVTTGYCVWVEDVPLDVLNSLKVEGTHKGKNLPLQSIRSGGTIFVPSTCSFCCCAIPQRQTYFEHEAAPNTTYDSGHACWW